MKIRPYEESDLPEVLSLLQRSDNTNRTAETWNGNHLTAILAFQEKKLVGAIPLEPRNFCISKSENIPLLWVTGAHVDPEYRSKGLGSQMDAELRRQFYPQYQAVFVYREDETSAAYRWYEKLGYQVLLPILSFKIETAGKSRSIGTNTTLHEGFDAIQKIESSLYEFHLKFSSSFGGRPKRHPKYWSSRIESHYYKAAYKYSVLKSEAGFALLGETSIRDGISRFDVLDFEFSQDFTARKEWFDALLGHAASKALKEVRIQFSPEEGLQPWFEEYGFTNRWRTNLMGCLVDPKDFLFQKVDAVLKLAGCQLNIATPKLGSVLLGDAYCQADAKKASVFLEDGELQKLLLHRTDFDVEGGQDCLKQMNIIFKKTPWAYRQLDYI